jgi:hypothetical protein
MRHRSVALIVLGAGLAILILGVVVAVVRADGDRDAHAKQRDRYAAALRDAAAVPPRFEVEYVQFPLRDLERLTRARGGRSGYAIVPTEIARRIETGRPPLHPDFAALPHSRYLDDVARAFSRGTLRQIGVDVIALLVRQTAPGPVAKLTLRVQRLVPRGYAAILDPTDLNHLQFDDAKTTTRTTQFITWKPAPGRAGMLVPLCLLHLVRVPTLPERSTLFSYAALGARELRVRQPDGRVLPLAIRDALDSPILLHVGPR